MTLLLADDQPTALRGLQAALAHPVQPVAMAHAVEATLSGAVARHAPSPPPGALPNIQTVKILRLEWTGSSANPHGCVIQQAKIFTG
ncbi:MAG: hypothetical protein ABR551_06735 [Gemmatimonadales bacterium]